MRGPAIKVCGLKSPANIRSVDALGVDYVGLIFYHKSPRYVTSAWTPQELNAKKVGVFVNASHEEIRHRIHHHDLTAIQLHGDESPDFCHQCRELRVEVWKAIPVHEEVDLSRIGDYEEVVDYVLLDTKTVKRGGSGERFDWNILSTYASEVPFWIAGGIGPENAAEIRALELPSFYGIDINSRFERAPGEKNIEQIKSFLHELRG